MHLLNVYAPIFSICPVYFSHLRFTISGFGWGVFEKIKQLRRRRFLLLLPTNHFREPFISDIAEHVQQMRNIPRLEVKLDRKTKESIEDPLGEFQSLLTSGLITKYELIEHMAQVESSELNGIFLYVVTTFGQDNRKLQRMTAEIQAHELRIQSFIDNLSDDLKPSVDIRRLPVVWQNKFLIVEDHEALRNLMAYLLGRKGAVETARDGIEAVDKLKKHFFNVIISDMMMPDMVGLELYRRAIAIDARLERNFLFCSGSITLEKQTFLQKHNLPFLHKPFDVNELTIAVDDIVSRIYENM